MVPEPVGSAGRVPPDPPEWPGVHCVGPLLAGQSEIQGTWYDRSREYILRRRGKDFTIEDYTQQETVTLTPLPCWKDLSPEAYRTRIEDLVQSIVTEAEAKRTRTGKDPLGPEAIRLQKPGTRPEKLKKSPAPYFHAFRKKVRKALYEGFALFVAEYREASEKLRAGERNVRFPERVPADSLSSNKIASLLKYRRLGSLLRCRLAELGRKSGRLA